MNIVVIGNFWFGDDVMEVVASWTKALCVDISQGRIPNHVDDVKAEASELGNKVLSSWSVLDIGTRNSLLLQELAKQGFSYLTGTDYSEGAISLAQSVANRFRPLTASVTAAPSLRAIAGRPCILLRHLICRLRRKDNHHRVSTSPSSRPVATPNHSPLAPHDSPSVAMQPPPGPHLRRAITTPIHGDSSTRRNVPPRVPPLSTQCHPRRRRRPPYDSSSPPPIWF
ncbi:Protein-lysine N-methyltransferase [Arachis hypogaea]|nr:Protein-lysine N-methyltransferase [Arachis hypogaea]